MQTIGLSKNFQIRCNQEINLIRARMIARSFGIEGAFDHILRVGDENNLPYHNPKHCTTVMRYAFDIAMMLRASDPSSLSDNEVRYLLCACLYHDFAHTGLNPDVNNIEIAVTNMRAGLTSLCETEFTEHDLDTIEGIIRVTEFPFVHEPKTLLQQIIRDADLMQPMDVDNIETVMDGLRAEVNAKFGIELTREQFYYKQVEFMNSVRMYTTPARMMYESAKPMIITCFFSTVFPTTKDED